MELRAVSNESLGKRTLAFYERASREGRAALEELPTVFSNDIHFMNPVVDEQGIDTFRAQWERAFGMYSVFNFSEFVLEGDDSHFTLSYVMKIQFLIGPVFVIPLVTECKGQKGKVVWMKDYFDTMTTLLQPVPPLLWLYKTIMRVLVA
jgi:hypothetical protein